MTIDEAIEQERSKVDSMVKHSERHCVTQEFFANVEYHEQLAEWLEELQNLKAENTYLHDEMQAIGATIDMLEEEIRNKAIDDFIENISLEISESLIWGMIADCFKYKNMNDTSDKIVDYVINTANEIAEKLKAGGTNGNSTTNT